MKKVHPKRNLQEEEGYQEEWKPPSRRPIKQELKVTTGIDVVHQLSQRILVVQLHKVDDGDDEDENYIPGSMENRKISNRGLCKPEKVSINRLTEGQMNKATPTVHVKKEKHSHSDHDDESPHHCLQCEKKYKHKETLEDHINTVHTKKVIYKCRYCPKTFYRAKLRQSHERLHIGTKNHACHLCPAKFFDKIHLEGHLRKHTQEKPFQCEFCDSAFPVTQQLADHRRVHTGERPYPCSYCDLTFTRWAIRSAHVKTIHQNLRPHICPVCQHAFSNSQQLKNHSSVHTGEKRFSCEYCERNFREKRSLVFHVRTHTGEKPFQCRWCTDRFARYNSREQHERSHKGLRNYNCKVCNSKFVRKEGLRIHLATQHKQGPLHTCEECGQTFRDKRRFRYHQRAHEGIKKFSCGCCGETFLFSWELNTHITKIHTKEKPFGCVECGKEFVHGTSLKDHYRVEHKIIK